jgi:hypothetical protein
MRVLRSRRIYATEKSLRRIFDSLLLCYMVLCEAIAL